MHSKPHQQSLPVNSTECCFVQFFSHNISQGPFLKKNLSGLINPYNDEKPLFQQNQLFFQPKIVKKQPNNQKRSISSIKANKRLTNRCRYQLEENRQLRKDCHITQKLKSSLKGSEAVHRYFSPKNQLDTTISKSQFQEKKKIEEFFNIRNINKKVQSFSGKARTFFKEQKSNKPIQFARSMKLLNPEATQAISSNIRIESKHDKTDEIQNINKNCLDLDPIVGRPVNLIRRQCVQTKQDFNLLFPISNFQSQEKLQLYQKLPKNTGRYQNPMQISIHNSIHIKLNEPKNHRQKLQVNSAALQKINEMSKSQNRHYVYLQAPVNTFRNFESFVMQVRKKCETNEDQKQYDSIKTKGKPVESMLQMTKDLTKTRKNIQYPNKTNQTGLREMYNITVTSEFDEDSQDQTRERIEESAVFLNFFNPPTHL